MKGCVACIVLAVLIGATDSGKAGAEMRHIESGRFRVHYSGYSREIAERLMGITKRSYPILKDYGFLASPLLHGDWLIVEVGHSEEGTIWAFDKNNGSGKWKSEHRGNRTNGSPTLTMIDGKPCVATVCRNTNIWVSLLKSGNDSPRRRYYVKARCLLNYVLYISIGVMIMITGSADAHKINGQLRVHPTNPRYFTDDSGNVIYLTGSHMWNNLIDMGKDDPPQPFDFPGYLDFLQRYGHNFIRLWAWDSVIWNTQANGPVLGKDFIHNVAPQPWARTGPGNALDGKPKFDLTKYNPEYFGRLRERVESAGKRGIYVSVMLFEGWGLYHANRRSQATVGWAWRSHPFHPDNNVNDIGADLAGEDNRPKVHSLTNPEATALQKAYIKKVVDTVNDLDNVLYEVINEGGDKDWDWWVVNTIHDYEKTKPKQHPVGITGHGTERLPSMLASPADWVSPGRADGYAEEPPAWNGEKVSLLDTDHVWGVGGNHAWVWKSFVRGHNPLFMDPYDGEVLGEKFDPKFELLRLNLGYTMRYAEKMSMAEMIPHNDLASTQYCLANPGKEYLIYLPDGGNVAIDLPEVKGSFAVEWFNPREGTTTGGGTSAGGKVDFTAPFDGDAVLYLLLDQP